MSELLLNELKRKSTESFKEYKERMRGLSKSYYRMLWDSSSKGTYVKKKHGELK